MTDRVGQKVGSIRSINNNTKGHELAHRSCSYAALTNFKIP